MRGSTIIQHGMHSIMSRAVEMDCGQVVRRVTLVEQAFKLLQQHGHLREMLLARFCFGGLKLRDAVKLEVSSIFGHSHESGLVQAVPSYSETSIYFDMSGKFT